MPTVTIRPISATEVAITIDAQSYVYKKAYCYTEVGGDYLYFFSHRAELNALRQQFAFLYSDVANPSATDAIKLKTAVDRIIGAYGIMDNGYLAYYDTTKQLNSLLVNYLQYNTKDFESGITIDGGDRIVFARDGIYNIQFSAQMQKIDSGKDSIEIWLERNAANIPNTSTVVSMDGNNTKYVAAWNWMVSVNADDIIKIAWYSADVNVEIATRGTATLPDRPEVPSVILTVQQVTGGNT